MARPKKDRIVKRPPLHRAFKPIGIPAKVLPEIQLSLDEYEALRLTDLLGMGHGEAADEMEISRSTFTRLVEKARKKSASFFINGGLLTIGGGRVHFETNLIKCNACGHMFNIDWSSETDNCPQCGSSDLIDMACSYGHGRCCKNRHRRGRNRKRRS